jgi:hypothetical protein
MNDAERRQWVNDSLQQIIKACNEVNLELAGDFQLGYIDGLTDALNIMEASYERIEG